MNSGLRPGGLFRLEGWLLKDNRLSTGAKMTYAVLACCSGGRDWARPSQAYLAAAVSASVRSIQNYLRELVQNQLIKVEKRPSGHTSRRVYRFIRPSGGRPEARKIQAAPPAPGPSAQTSARPEAEGQAREFPPPGEKYAPSYKNINKKNNKEEAFKARAALSPRGAGPAETPAAAGKPPQSPSLNPGWLTARRLLARELEAIDYQAFIEPLGFVETRDKGCFLTGPNLFYLKQLWQRFREPIVRALKSAGFKKAQLTLDEPAAPAEAAGRFDLYETRA